MCTVTGKPNEHDVFSKFNPPFILRVHPRGVLAYRAGGGRRGCTSYAAVSLTRFAVTVYRTSTYSQGSRLNTRTQRETYAYANAIVTHDDMGYEVVL